MKECWVNDIGRTSVDEERAAVKLLVLERR